MRDSETASNSNVDPDLPMDAIRIGGIRESREEFTVSRKSLFSAMAE